MGLNMPLIFLNYIIIELTIAQIKVCILKAISAASFETTPFLPLFVAHGTNKRTEKKLINSTALWVL